MSQYALEAKDCLQFTFKGKKPEGDNALRVIDKAMRQICNYWYKADGYSDDDNYLVRMQTLAESDKSAEPMTQWWAGRYIGIARLRVPINTATHQIDISIRPRFGETFLLAIIEDIYNIKVFIQNAKDSTSIEWFSSLLNILRCRMWVDKCAKANRYGLPRTNVKREHQGATLRGALDVRRTIMPWLMKQEICTNTYEKTLDDNICRIVYEAHRILSRDITTAKKKKDKQTANINVGLGFSMPSTVQDTIDALNSQYKGSSFDLTENDYHRIRYKSISQSWKPLVDFSWSIIRGHQFSYKASESQTECVFVDMAEIWEAFLRKKLGEELKKDGWRVLSVEESHFLIYKGNFYERDIIPDIILQQGDNYIVFDAKYKRMRGDKFRGNYSDVDRADLFQIHTYIQYFQHIKKRVVLGGLLYPITKSNTTERKDVDVITFHSNSLYGCEGEYQTTFIVDGIYCPESIVKEIKPENVDKQKNVLDENVKAMIDRIKKYL